MSGIRPQFLFTSGQRESIQQSYPMKKTFGQNTSNLFKLYLFGGRRFGVHLDLPQQAVTRDAASERNRRCHFRFDQPVRCRCARPPGIFCSTPSNPTAYKNHDAASKEFDSPLDTLEQRLRCLFPGSEAGEMLAAIKTDFQSHLTIQRKIHDLSRRGEFNEAKAELNSLDTPLWRKYKQSMLDSRKWLDHQAAQVSTEIQAGCRTAQALSWLCGLILVSAGLGAFLMSGRVGKKLRDVAQSLREGAEQIARAAGQVATSSRSLAEGANQQAAALEETSASTEEISSMARHNDDSLQSAAALAMQSEHLAETNRALDQTLASIADINNSSDKISRIIRVIDEIAFQTNILALNAAVEAARAGEAGMGFGVVADEVRNLAQRCAQAARDTTGLIGESVSGSRDGNAKVDQVALSIRNFAAGSSQIQSLVDEVSKGARQQTEGLAQIARAMAQMDTLDSSDSR